MAKWIEPRWPSTWRAVALVLAVGAMWFTPGCGGEEDGDGGTGAGAPSERVVATIWPLADVTRQLLPEAIAVDVLLPPGQSPHGFDLTPKQLRRLGDAELMVSVGLSVDAWAEDAAGHTGRDMDHWRMADAVLNAADHDDHDDHGDHGDHDEHGEHEDHEGHDDHDHAGVDPHLWLDPVLMRLAVDDLSRHLIERFPDHAEAIAQRTADYVKQLEELDGEYREQIGRIDQPRIATFHGAFDRLAERYGIEVVATLMPFDPVGEVQMSRIEGVRRVIREHDLKALFIEPQFSDTAAKVIQRNADVELILLDPIGDPWEPRRDSYVKMMRFNLEQLMQGLTR